MAHGKVTVWYMTEEERLAYIEKHPIVPAEKPKGSTFENVHSMQQEKSNKRNPPKRLIDDVDKELHHKLFLEGKTINEMAQTLKINASTLNNYIAKQRKREPEKWPYRAKSKTHRPG